MPKGISIPLEVSASGGALTVKSDENDKKIIRLALSDDDNENAFQQNIGLGERMIFELDTPSMRSWIVQRTKKIFVMFAAQKRFKLLDDTIMWDDQNSVGGKSMVKFRYLNLESDEEKEFDHQFGAGA